MTWSHDPQQQEKIKAYMRAYRARKKAEKAKAPKKAKAKAPAAAVGPEQNGNGHAKTPSRSFLRCIAQLVAAGYTATEIAHPFDLDPATAKELVRLSQERTTRTKRQPKKFGRFKTRADWEANKAYMRAYYRRTKSRYKERDRARRARLEQGDSQP